MVTVDEDICIVLAGIVCDTERYRPKDTLNNFVLQSIHNHVFFSRTQYVPDVLPDTSCFFKVLARVQ